MKFRSLIAITLVMIMTSLSIATPYATELVSFSQGPGATPDYDQADTVLGVPPSVDSFDWPINIDAAPWETADVVSLGNGGSITIKFDHQVMNNDIGVEYGIDLLVFGNSFFSTDWDTENQIEDYSIIGTNFEPATVAVSQDGITFYEIDGVYADDLYPYTSLKGDYVHATPAAIDYMGRQAADVLVDYQNGCGGAQIDISNALGAPTTLDWIQYVKITDIAGDAGIADVVAFADVVPEPATLIMLALGACFLKQKK
jgi:hypothetical protein